jgi:hypothetical protein
MLKARKSNYGTAWSSFCGGRGVSFNIEDSIVIRAVMCIFCASSLQVQNLNSYRASGLTREPITDVIFYQQSRISNVMLGRAHLPIRSWSGRPPGTEVESVVSVQM